MIFELLILFALILISALFSSGESAFFSLTSTQKNQLKLEQPYKKRSKFILECLKQPEKTLSAILLGNLATNIFISNLGHSLINTHTNFSNLNANLVSLVLITTILLIFAEIIPKILTLRVPLRWSLTITPFLRTWFIISHYLSQAIYYLIKYTTKKLSTSRIIYKEEELLNSISLAFSYKLIEEHEKNTLKRSVIFHHDTVFQTMIPRSKVFMVPHNESPIKIKKKFLDNHQDFSIIYHVTTKKLLGYLHKKGLIIVLYKGLKLITNKIQNIIFLPQTMPLDQALKNMIKEKIEVAAIVDESGEFSGVLTLKHLLKKLMGDWKVGSKFEPNLYKLIKKIDDQVYRVKGFLTLNQFNDFFSMHLKHEEIETISGYLIHKLDGFPKKSTSITIDNLDIYNIKMRGHRLDSFLVRNTHVR